MSTSFAGVRLSADAEGNSHLEQDLTLWVCSEVVGSSAFDATRCVCLYERSCKALAGLADPSLANRPCS
jgi:hypothetical protein